MDLDFTDEQDMLRKTVRSLCADAAATVRQFENDPRGYDDGFWQKLASMGLCGLMVPEAYGGSAMGLLDAVVVYEELGRSLVPSPHFVSSVLSAGVLQAAGSREQQDVWLPRIASGEAILTPAWLEPDNGSGPEGIQLHAETDGGADVILTGTKRHVAFASSANRLVVLARTEAGIDLLLIDPAAEGVTLTQQLTVASDTQYRVDLDGVRVPTTDRIGAPGSGWDTWHTVMLDALVLIAAFSADRRGLLGVVGAEAILSHPISYLGWHNESPWQIEWVLDLRAELDRRGKPHVKLVVADCGPGAGFQTPELVQWMQSNTSLSKAAAAVGLHYPNSRCRGAESD